MGDRASVIRIGESITLTAEQLRWATEVGIARERESLKAGLRDRRCSTHGSSEDSDIEGACSELAFDLLMGRPWSASVNSFGKPDSGDYDHVRSTEYRTGRLIIRFWDPPVGIYVLMVGVRPTYVFRGAASAEDVRRPQYISDPNGKGPAYFVPQNALDQYGDVQRWFLRQRTGIEEPMLTQADLQW
jgi:hypothetical protein